MPSAFLSIAIARYCASRHRVMQQGWRSTVGAESGRTKVGLARLGQQDELISARHCSCSRFNNSQQAAIFGSLHLKAFPDGFPAGRLVRSSFQFADRNQNKR